LAAAQFVLTRATGAARTAAIAFCAVAGGLTAGFLLAWQLDLGRIASSSSTAGLAFVFVPIYATVAGLLAAAAGAGIHLLWRRAGGPRLSAWLAVTVFVLVMVGTGGAFLRTISASPDWPDAGVLSTAPTLERGLVLESDLPGMIRWIGEVRLAGADVIAVVRPADVELLDLSLQRIGHLRAVSDTGGPAWMGLRPAVLAHDDWLRVFQGGGGYGAVRLRHLDGTVVWDFEQATGEQPAKGIVVPARPGRQLRYVVAARSGVHGYDTSFTRLWRAGGGAVTDVSVADSDGLLTLVARRPDGAVVLLDESGRVTGKLPARPALRFTRAVVWPHATVIVAGRKGKLALLDTAGHVQREWPLEPLGRNPVVETARFGLPGDPHLVVLAESSSGIAKAVLTVIAVNGDVVHREVVARSAGLHTLRRSEGDLLLFGDGRRRVWSLAAASPHTPPGE
jgi:hypothetical protein